VASIPVPEIGEREILIRVDTSGIGSWDPWMREGGMGGGRFPQVLGSDGSGTVAACGLTALAGLDVLKLKKGWALMILGASGGCGHLALQLAKRRGARVLALASGKDGVDLAKRLGSDLALNGRGASLVRAARQFAPQGYDAAMAFANSKPLTEALKLLKKGGTIAYPNGVEPEPNGFTGVNVRAFDGLADPGAFKRLNGLIARGPFCVDVSRFYRLEELPQAHRDVLKHHLGKLAVKVRG